MTMLIFLVNFHSFMLFSYAREIPPKDAAFSWCYSCYNSFVHVYLLFDTKFYYILLKLKMVTYLKLLIMCIFHLIESIPTEAYYVQMIPTEIVPLLHNICAVNQVITMF